MKKKVFLGIVIALLIIIIIVETILLVQSSKKGEIKEDETISAKDNDRKETDKELEQEPDVQESTKPEKTEPLPSPSTLKGSSITIKKEYFENNEKKPVYTYMVATVENNGDENNPPDKYEIPQIAIESDYVKKVNEKILKKFENLLKEIEKNQMKDFIKIGLTYEYSQYNNILSVAMFIPSTSSASFECDIYNIDMTTGNKVENDELIEKLGYNDEDLSEMIYKAMNAEVKKQAENFDISETDETFWTKRNTAIKAASNTKANQCSLFINGNKHLCVYTKTVNLGLAGGESGCYVFDLVSGEIYIRGFENNNKIMK